MFTIRVAKSADAKRIARIHVDTWHVAYRGQIASAVLDTPSVEQREAFWLGRFEQARGSVFVIERDEIIGFCDLIPSREKDADPKAVCEIAAVYVVSDHWNVGGGKVLCYHVLAEARKRGYQAVTLWVLASNSNAMRFFESLGFARDGVVKIETAPDGSNLHKIRYRIKFNRTEQT